ncbi:hypothetical protein DM01DRAFT_1334112 [Hesseltinella vesiculosa]|uniref:Tubulin--tyrosine ligase-like protein 12 SET-like domain-containing protein n=1 Tax=Hesseltinella vesiculosa TaxID=101127 RepID=A0A1X2GMZ8_9FUNG|nr:hypothetical protein DM01DRAFT_1334112 [Hesseltinella vesiculosa]
MASAFESFVAVHQYQLASIPEELWQPLFMKLGEDYLDAGSVMELHLGDPVDGYSLHVKQDAALEKHSDIFLIDHAWTTSVETAKKELEDNPTLLERVENLMNIEKEAWVDEDASDSEIEHDDEIIRLVADQANVSYEQAKAALVDENYEVVNAITNLTLDPEFKKQADALQEQVMGQLIASGKAQEKEEKVNKEKEERNQQRRKEWNRRRIDNVYHRMWSFVQTYSYAVLQTDGQSETKTALYVNDEVGSALCHSSKPNMVCVPFIFSRGASGVIPYSVLFPLTAMAAGDLVTVDMVPKALTKDLDRMAYLLAIEHRIAPSNETLIDTNQLVNAYQQIQSAATPSPSPSAGSISTLTLPASGDEVRVFTDLDCVRANLTTKNVKWVSNSNEADVSWLGPAGSSSTASNQLVSRNQSCLTSLAGLSALIRTSYGATTWFPATWDLKHRLGECVGDFLHKEQPWILKPDTVAGQGRLASGVAEIIRQIDLPSPALAQHYLAEPCLYNGKKFTLQFTVVVRQHGSDLLAGLYRRFWIRLANKKYQDATADDREAHLLDTPLGAYQMTSLDPASFTRHLEKEQQTSWSSIESSIHQIIKDVLLAANTQPEPLGFSKEQANAFGIYTFDVALTSALKPVLMRVHDSSQCGWLCKDDKHFVNHALSLVDPRFGNVDKNAVIVL